MERRENLFKTNPNPQKSKYSSRHSFNSQTTLENPIFSYPRELKVRKVQFQNKKVRHIKAFSVRNVSSILDNTSSVNPNQMINESVFSSMKVIETKKLQEKFKKISFSNKQFSIDFDLEKVKAQTQKYQTQPSSKQIEISHTFDSKHKVIAPVRQISQVDFIGLRNADLSGMNLASIDQSLFGCVHLEVINLKNNSIQMIPSDIQKLKQLRELNLENNLVHIISKHLCEMQLLSKVILEWGFVEPSQFYEDLSTYVFKNSLFNRIEFIHFFEYATFKLKQKQINKTMVLRKFVDSKTHFAFLEKLGMRFNLGGILGYAHKKPSFIKRTIK